MKATRMLPFLLLTALITSCAAADADAQSTATSVPLTPYASPVPTETLAAPVVEITPTALPLPTATPLLVEVVSGDTLLGIALRHGLTLEALLAANPEVDPQFLVVGTVLHIPASDTEIVTLPEAQATPVSLDVGPPHCYADTAGGTWCVSAISNASGQAVENVVLAVQAIDSSGEPRFSQAATLLLNRLPDGATLPLLAYFDQPATAAQVVLQLRSALPLPADSTRYLPIALNGDPQVLILNDGRSADVSANLILNGSTDAQRVWVLAVAVDADGRVVGVRRWENSIAWPAGTSADVALTVYSLGPPIDHVQLFLEAQP